MGIQRKQLTDIPSGAFTERVGKWKGMLTQMGPRNSLSLECLTKNTLLEREDPPICTLPAVWQNKFIVKYTGKLIAEDIQLVIDSCLLHFHLQEGQGQKRTDNTNIRHLLISISSKFYYQYFAQRTLDTDSIFNKNASWLL